MQAVGCLCSQPSHLPTLSLLSWGKLISYNFKRVSRLVSQSQSFQLYCMHSSHFSHVRLFATPWPVAHQAPLSREFCRQEYWSGCFSLLQGMFLTQGSNLCLLHCRQILYLLSYQLKPLLAFTFSHLECKLHFGKHLLYSLMFLRHLEWCLTLSRYSVNIF